MGRYISEDLARVENPYVYAGNNPIKFADPFGLFKVQLARAAVGTELCVGIWGIEKCWEWFTIPIKHFGKPIHERITEEARSKSGAQIVSSWPMKYDAFDIGLGLHTAQDFWSHSTAVDIIERGGSIKCDWGYYPNSDPSCPGLKSGRFEGKNLLKVLADMICLDIKIIFEKRVLVKKIKVSATLATVPDDAHCKLNKDEEDRRGYWLARSKAIETSVSVIRDACSKNPSLCY